MPDLIDAKGEYFTKTAGVDSKLDFAIDWASFLSGAETIAISVWTVPTGITQDVPFPSISGSLTIIWLSGGTAGIEYTLLNKITTSDGRKEQRQLRVVVVPSPTLAANALIDIDYLKTFLSMYESEPLQNVNNVLLGHLIDSTSDKIERYCKRTFNVGDFLKREQWDGCINLSPYPIHYVQGIYRETRGGFILTNSAANKARASAWITENRKLYLEIAGGASHGIQNIDLTLPANDTLSELVSAINGLSGNWTATLATNRTGYELSEDLLAGFAGRRVLETGLTFSLLGEALSCEYTLNEESGILKDLRTPYPLSNYRFEGNPVWIKFRGGYDTIPDDLKAITARICQFFYAESKRDPGLASERIGDYSYNRYNTETSQQLDMLPSNLKRELDLWIDHSR